jgi:hypothetical protein
MNEVWIGVLAGILVGEFAPEWMKIITFIASLLLSGLLIRFHPSGHAHLMASPGVIAIAGVIFGIWSWHYARKRGLQHLGKSELATRWERVREESKWGF